MSTLINSEFSRGVRAAAEWMRKHVYHQKFLQDSERAASVMVSDVMAAQPRGWLPDHLLPPVAEPVIVGEDAYPDLTDDQWEKLVTLLPQDTQRRIVSRIQFGSAPVTEPPADAEVAQASALGMAFSEFQAEVAKSGALIRLEAIHQAERAVIEAAMKWKQGLSEAGKRELDEIIAAADRLDDARQRSAAAKEQPNAPKKPCGHEYVRCDKNRTSGVAWVCDLCGCDIPLKAAARERG